MSKKEHPADSFEQHMDSLEKLVARLEQGGLPLEEAMAAFEQGLQHADACESLLDTAQKKMDALMAAHQDADPKAEE